MTADIRDYKVENKIVDLYVITENLIKEIFISICKNNSSWNKLMFQLKNKNYNIETSIELMNFPLNDASVDTMFDRKMNDIKFKFNISQYFASDNNKAEMLRYIKEVYNFNYEDYCNKNKCNSQEFYILFMICHEIGHMKQHLEDINIHGFPSQQHKDTLLYEYCNFLHFIGGDTFKTYRQIPSEALADKKAIEILNSVNVKKLIENNIFSMLDTEVTA